MSEPQNPTTPPDRSGRPPSGRPARPPAQTVKLSPIRPRRYRAQTSDDRPLKERVWGWIGRIATLAAVLLGLLVVAALAVYYLWVPGFAEEKVRDRLATLSERLGQELSFGHLEVHGPRQVVLHDVVLARDDRLHALDPEPFLTVPRIEITLDPIATLKNDRPKVDKVVLVAPHVEFVRGRDGRSDLDPVLDWLEGRRGDKEGQDTDGLGAGNGRALPLVRIDGGTLRLRDQLHPARVRQTDSRSRELLSKLRAPIEYARDINVEIVAPGGFSAPGSRVVASAVLEPTAEPLPITMPRRVKLEAERVKGPQSWVMKADLKPEIIVTHIPRLPKARLSVRGLGLDGSGKLRALGVELAHRTTHARIAEIDEAEVEVGNLNTNMDGQVALGSVKLRGLRLDLQTHPDGRNNLTELLGEQAPAPKAGPKPNKKRKKDSAVAVVKSDDWQRHLKWLPTTIHYEDAALTWRHQGRLWSVTGAKGKLEHTLAAQTLRAIASYTDASGTEGAFDLTAHYNRAQPRLQGNFQEVDAVALAHHLRLPHHELARKGRFSGQFDLTRRTQDGHFKGSGRVQAHGLAVFHRKLAREALEGMDFEVGGQVTWDPSSGDLDIERAHITLEDAATVRLGVNLEGIGHGNPRAALDLKQIKLRINLEDTPAQELFEAVPKALRAEIDGMKMVGTVGWTFSARINPVNISEMRTESNVRLKGFDIVDYNEHTDVRKLNRSFVHTVTQPETGYKFRIRADSPAWVRLGRISPFVVKALRTNEDGSFFSHKGFSWMQIRATLEQNIKARRVVRGASTVSMQLVKNVFLSHERTMARKLQEAMLTFAMEQVERIPKRRILEIYLNIVEWGPNVYGVRKAARHYFNRPPWGLRLGESVFLISILPGPRKFHRYKERGWISDQWWARMQRLIGVMLDRNHITEEQHDEAIEDRPFFRRASIDPIDEEPFDEDTGDVMEFDEAEINGDEFE